jgi:hypothetical protein
MMGVRRHFSIAMSSYAYRNRVRTAAQAEARSSPIRRQMMNEATRPADELFVTQFLVVSDQDRSRDFYQSVFGAGVLRDRDPVVLALANAASCWPGNVG